MKNYLILHGHFYQPPRENPVTGLIPLQKSAAPYHDWNARITKECYGANSASRILTEDGRILDIVNNYENISFNIGPTLLDWLKTEAPNVYERIIEADRKSVIRNGGHGNAIAQGFNHTILPLDTRHDAETQIRCGIENFTRHFSRKPEGFWLPEAAVNGDVADILVKYGIKFIILSPDQARTAEKASDPAGGNQVPDSSVPYVLRGTSGDLAVFFYNPVLAGGISFSHYLRSADTLYEKLLECGNAAEGNLVHTATDGEIYGHHEPFGDMCLAALSKIAAERGDFIFTNYGRYLSSNPPVREVVLQRGEDGKGTSWSCFHGVSRWYKDCGCSTGGEPGWNQKWRTPLREAFRYLGERIDNAYVRETGKLSTTPPWRLLAEYLGARGTEPSDRFASHFLKIPGKENITKLLKLLEGQRMKLFSFTSCGWFFADISGIEPVQNMRYASRALELYGDILHESVRHRVLDILERAAGNKSREISGKSLFLSVQEPYPEGFCASLYFSAVEEKEKYGIFRLIKKENNGRSLFIETENTITTETFSFEITLPAPEDVRFTVEIKNLGITLNSLRELDEDLKTAVIESAVKRTGNYRLRETLYILRYCMFMDIPAPENLNGNTRKLIEDLIKKTLNENMAPMDTGEYERLTGLIKASESLEISFDKTVPQNIVMDKLKYIRENRIRDGILYEQTVELCSLLGIYCDDIRI